MKSEKSIEKALRERVKKLGGLALKFWCLSFSGMPDRIVLMPGGRIWFVELKSPGKKPTSLQLRVHALLVSLGFEVWVIDNENRLNELLIRIDEI